MFVQSLHSHLPTTNWNPQTLGANSAPSTESTLLYLGNFMVSVLLSRYAVPLIRSTVELRFNPCKDTTTTAGILASGELFLTNGS